MSTLALVGAAVAIAAVAVTLSARFVKDHERLVIFRMGRTRPSLERGPGFAFLIPIVDRGVRVDMRPRTLDLFNLPARTDGDEAVVVDATFRYRVVDAFRSVVNAANVDGALQGVIQTTIRSIAGQQARSDVLAARHRLTDAVQAKLSEPATRWGVEIERFEVIDIRAVGS